MRNSALLGHLAKCWRNIAGGGLASCPGEGSKNTPGRIMLQKPGLNAKSRETIF